MSDSKPVRNVEGLAASAAHPSDKHPGWYAPTSEPVSSLHMLNSLTETVMPFAAINGRVVKWYTCGPTVYDMSHMGHARAYLTFDIIRRIMEDYFGYSIEYQMNITDIDDKIIKRARVNKLVSDFRAAAKDVASVRPDVDAAVALAKSTLDARAAELSTPLPADAISRLVDERDEQLKILEMKREQLAATTEAIAEAAQANDLKKLIDKATGVLGEWLDVQKGGEITDHEIFNAHARKYEAEYFEDMRRLGIRDPDVISRVTEVVPQVVDYVQKIMDNGFAYKGESSVFFDTEAFVAAGHSYPKNLPTKQGGKNATTADQMAEGEGSLSAARAGEKKSANDFALWKFSKPGEPAWPSPWGEGRPGWHIECSVMASEILGENMDIHAGGCDLKFPHHDNELAQAEAYWGHHQWVNYFLHCGHLHIKGLKMSKSLKNFITIRQALDDLGVTPRQMRLLFLSNPWDRSMNFSDQSLGDAKEKERVLRAFFGSIDIVLREDYLKKAQGFNQLDAAINKLVTETDVAVHNALSNNFDTVTAMERLMALVKATNEYLLSGERPSATLLKKVSRYVSKILRVFGVIQGSDDLGFTSEAAAGSDGRTDKVVDALVAFRDEVRQAFRDKELPAVMKAADRVRDELLPPLGVRLEDKPSGPTQWKNDDPAVLMRELKEKQQAARLKEVTKLKNALAKQEKELAKWAPFVAKPETLFRSKPEFAQKGEAVEYDERGVPVKIDGAAVDEKTANKMGQEFNAYKKSHEQLMTKKGGEEYVKSLHAEVADLAAKVAALEAADE